MTPVVEIVRDLRRLLNRLEGMIATRPIDAQIVEALEDVESASTQALAGLIRRRRSDVLATLRLLAAAGRVARSADGKRWVLNEAA